MLACRRIKPYGFWFIGLVEMVLGPYARNGDIWIKGVASQIKGRMGQEKATCGHIKGMKKLLCNFILVQSTPPYMTVLRRY